jgi:hypothetical protein
MCVGDVLLKCWYKHAHILFCLFGCFKSSHSISGNWNNGADVCTLMVFCLNDGADMRASMCLVKGCGLHTDMRVLLRLVQ